MFSTKTAVTNTGSKYMAAGINNDVVIKEVNVQKSPTGRDFLEIVFENQSGQTATMTEWKNEKGPFVKTDEDLQRRDNLQFGRILQVINCFMETIPDVELSTFKDMIVWVKSTLDAIQEKDKQPLRLKVTYDNKGFTRVSSNGIFVEPMDVKESQIKITGRDRIERPVIPTDNNQADPLTGNSTPETSAHVNTGTGADDLPF